MNGPKYDAGIAAFLVREALLFSVNDQRLLPGRQIIGLLGDAATIHENAVGPDVEIETQWAVANLINMIISGEIEVHLS